jgi:hypothetical protein
MQSSWQAKTGRNIQPGVFAMTTMTFNDVAFNVATRAPRTSFAARLAALQARQEQAPHLTSVFGVAARAALAAIPFGALACLFVFV